MITWMQKHKKYLIWTIWVSTIAFVGAGFVGWGRYSMGSASNVVSKVGDIEITKSKYNNIYTNIYSYYKNLLGGKLDEEQAKKMHLRGQAFSLIVDEAHYLNYAKKLQLDLSDETLYAALKNKSGFQVNGTFDSELYLKNIKTTYGSPKVFEQLLKEEKLAGEIKEVFQAEPTSKEIAIISAIVSAKEKLRYVIKSSDSFDSSYSEKELKEFFEANKQRYTLPETYNFELYTILPHPENITDEDAKSHYEKNSYLYVAENGSIKAFDEVRDAIKLQLAVKASKKEAQLAYIAIKKGKKVEIEPKNLTRPRYSNDIDPKAWKEIVTFGPGATIKPFVSNNAYRVLKVIYHNTNTTVTLEKARELVLQEVKEKKLRASIQSFINNQSSKFDATGSKVSDFISLKETTTFDTLDENETREFMQQLSSFESDHGAIRTKNHVIAFEILEQKLAEDSEPNEDVEAYAKSAKIGSIRKALRDYFSTIYKTVNR